MAETIRRKYVNGRRYYEVIDGSSKTSLLPSITTVLGETSDKSGLDEWRNKVGHEEADRISKLSMNRGTIMHRLIELYKPLIGSPDERLDELKQIAANDREINQFEAEALGQEWHDAGWDMFMKFWYNHSRFFDRVKTVLAAETFLWSIKGGGYAGTVDNVSEMIDNNIIIVDYKNSRKPKRENWIQDYFIQASAYYIAYWERTGVQPNGVEIWIANEIDNIPQVFKLNNEDVKYYFKEFSNRLKQFYEMVNI